MESRVSPCDSCQKQDKASCIGCLKWREWYCNRQSMINAFAAQLERSSRYWTYQHPEHQQPQLYIEKRVSPCGGCTNPDKASCTGCLRWQHWYCNRQSMINAYAEKIKPVWEYELPLRRITKEDPYEDIQANQQRQDCNYAEHAPEALPSI